MDLTKSELRKVYSEILFIKRFGSNNNPSFSRLVAYIISLKDALLNDSNTYDFIYENRRRFIDIYATIQTKIIPEMCENNLIGSKKIIEVLITQVFQNILNMHIGGDGTPCLNNSFLIRDFLNGIIYFKSSDNLIYTECEILYIERKLHNFLENNYTNDADNTLVYPNESFIVNIECKGHMPVALILERQKKNKRIHSTRYERSLMPSVISEYDEFVQCIRMTPKDTYFAIQMYTDMAPTEDMQCWHKIVSNPVRLLGF